MQSWREIFRIGFCKLLLTMLMESASLNELPGVKFLKKSTSIFYDEEES